MNEIRKALSLTVAMTLFAASHVYAERYTDIDRTDILTTQSTETSVMKALEEWKDREDAQFVMIDWSELTGETPTAAPTATPTAAPTAAPTAVPTAAPTAAPTATPLPFEKELTDWLSGSDKYNAAIVDWNEKQSMKFATEVPTPTPTPTAEPTQAPTAAPTIVPTEVPTAASTTSPTEQPTAEPTAAPTTAPTEQPTAEPTATPTTEPTEQPTVVPTIECNLTVDEDAAEVSADIMNTNDDDRNAVIIVAQYDDAGTLLNIKLVEVTVPGNMISPEKYTVKADHISERKSSIRGFVWDGLASMKPISKLTDQ